MQRTLSRIAEVFFWPKLRQDVQRYVSTCAVCQATKPFNQAPQGLLQPLPIPGLIWHSISMDFITGLPPSQGKTTIMVVVDRLSKHAHFSTLGASFTAQQFAELMVKDVIKIHGVPAQIVSDRDPIFMSNFWRELFRLQGTMLAMSTAYHPQTEIIPNSGRAFSHGRSGTITRRGIRRSKCLPLRLFLAVHHRPYKITWRAHLL